MVVCALQAGYLLGGHALGSGFTESELVRVHVYTLLHLYKLFLNTIKAS